MTRLIEVYGAFDLDSDGMVSSAELLELGRARRWLGQKKGSDEWTPERNAHLVRRIGCDAMGDIAEADFVR